ncbi:MAG: Na/Pi symporter [Planctomycetota bacterium]|nr:Na/Pi symporter [Planctomycetota bacterium]
MLGGIVQAAGGLGLFLLGTTVMTGGLRTMADERLLATLARTTKWPFSGVCTGAIATASPQSSSVISVAAVGYVLAELLTFSQALGIIFGAKITVFVGCRIRHNVRWPKLSSMKSVSLQHKLS